MNIQRYSKIEIALQQIETALRLFGEGNDFFSVVTLAGAAEEILGQLLDGRRGPRRSLLEILRPANRKKQSGEGLAGEETVDHIHTDPRQEAVFLLGRAIDDFHAVTGSLSTAMQKFNREVRG